MAAGQLTYLQMTNRCLLRLGHPQVVSADFAGLAADSYGGFCKDLLNEAQGEVAKEHDWSTLITSGTFTTSSRTYTLSTNFSDFGREIDLSDTTNRRVLEPTILRSLDVEDPAQTNAGDPVAYTIEYPNLLFNVTPASLSYRLRYVKRPTALSVAGSVSDLPEYCDMALIWWTVWQLAASREDASEGGAVSKAVYDSTLARAIAQDRRRVDRLWRMMPVFPREGVARLRFPSGYGSEGYGV